MADKNQNLVKYGEVIAKCWEDEAYRKRFIEDPESVLSEAGFVVEEGVTYKVVEQPKMVKYLVLPHADTKDAVQEMTKAFGGLIAVNDLSFNVEEGGYVHEDGTYTRENTLVLTLIDADKSIVEEIAKDLCVFFHQESVLITEGRVHAYYISESLE